MIKKIALPLAVIAIAAGTTLGATGAFFSDVKEAKGNVFSAGTLSIVTPGGDGWANRFFAIDGNMPGDMSLGSLDVKTSADSWLRIKANIAAAADVEADKNLKNQMHYAVYETRDGGSSWTKIEKATNGYYYPDKYVAGNDANYKIGIKACYGTLGYGSDADHPFDDTCSGSSVNNNSQGGKVNADFEIYAVQYENNENSNANPLKPQ